MRLPLPASVPQQGQLPRVLGVFGGIEEESDIDEDAQDRCQVGVERRHGVGLLSLHVGAR